MQPINISLAANCRRASSGTYRGPSAHTATGQLTGYTNPVLNIKGFKLDTAYNTNIQISLDKTFCTLLITQGRYNTGDWSDKIKSACNTDSRLKEQFTSNL
jgi:hypothetical protein